MLTRETEAFGTTALEGSVMVPVKDVDCATRLVARKRESAIAPNQADALMYPPLIVQKLTQTERPPNSKPQQLMVANIFGKHRLCQGKTKLYRAAEQSAVPVPGSAQGPHSL